MNDAPHIPPLADPYSLPLDQLNPARPEAFAADAHWGYFERLRREDPVHFTAESEFGPYWSITRYNDIMAIDTNHQVFSSDAHLGGITLRDMDDDFVEASGTCVGGEYISLRLCESASISFAMPLCDPDW